MIVCKGNAVKLEGTLKQLTEDVAKIISVYKKEVIEDIAKTDKKAAEFLLEHAITSGLLDGESEE